MEELLEETEQPTKAASSRRKPSDLLSQRQSFMRRFAGDEREIPTIEQLMKHADKFGSDQVVETAVELGYGLDACVRLMDHCDRVDVKMWNLEHKFSNNRKIKPSEERCKLLLGIEDEEDEDGKVR